MYKLDLPRTKYKTMTTKRTIGAVIVAFLISNVLTTLWYMLTDEANTVDYRRPEINYLGLMLNHVIYAGLMVHLLPGYLRSTHTPIRGFQFGVLIAALMYLPQALVIRSIWTVDFNAIFVYNTLAHLGIGGIMGTVLTLIYHRK